MKRGVQDSASTGPALNGEAGADLQTRCLERAFRHQAKRYCQKLRRCQRKLSEKSIHQSRVETRRLLALLGLLSEFLPARTVARLERALKRHLDAFDELRDTQVQLKHMAAQLETFPAARPFQAWLRQRRTRFHKQTSRRLERIRNRRLGRLLDDGRRRVEKRLRRCPSRQVAAALLRSLELAFTTTWDRHKAIEPEDTATIHRTRVAFKRFRYMLEALLQHCLPPNPQFLEALHDYQTAMGNIQDAEVLLQTLDLFRLDHPRLAARLGPFQTACRRRRSRFIRAYLRSAGPLTRFWPLPDLRTARAPAAPTRPGTSQPATTAAPGSRLRRKPT